MQQNWFCFTSLTLTDPSSVVDILLSSYLLGILKVSFSLSKMHERNRRQGNPHQETKRRWILHVFCSQCSCFPWRPRD